VTEDLEHVDGDQSQKSDQAARAAQQGHRARSEIVEQKDEAGLDRLRRQALDRLLFQLPEQRVVFVVDVLDRDLGALGGVVLLQLKQQPGAGGVDRIDAVEIERHLLDAADAQLSEPRLQRSTFGDQPTPAHRQDQRVALAPLFDELRRRHAFPPSGRAYRENAASAPSGRR
jgi:hypothetical protein